MTSSAAANESLLRERFQVAGQGHVFDHYDSLDTDEQTSLLEQLADIRVEKLADLLTVAQQQDNVGDNDDKITIEPFSGHVGSSLSNDDNDSYETRGLEAIQQGQVAALVLAGGQGTRLGFDGPKGMYDIQLPSGKTLFQLMAERIVKIKQLAGAAGSKDEDVSLPFYIMTSPINHEATVTYFDKNNYFGLGQDNVMFFQQGMLPCLTPEGKIIMETKHRVSMAPDGNGGIYPSLLASGCLDDMQNKRNCQYLHVFSIDNALVKPADPKFLGFCLASGAQCGNKSTWKSHAHEKVGVVALRQGKPCVVEYSEITTEMAERTDESGKLAFGAGNICNHFYTIDFLRNTVLPNMGDLYHIAKKKIPYYDAEQNATVKPEEVNGIKLETFIFDVFPLAGDQFCVWEVPRADEFAPVKNAPGTSSDSPDTARAMISDQGRRWFTAAGAKVETNDKDAFICEISPLVSYNGEGLEAYKDKTISGPVLE